MKSTDQSHPAQKYLDLKLKNLEFFKRYYPGIYSYFSSYEMKTGKVDILTEADEVDLIVDGQHVYKGQCQKYAKKEVATFLSAYDYGSKIKSVRPLEKDTYKNQRFFARSVSEVYEAYYRQDGVFEGYQLGNFFPLVVFMGVGLGKQVDILCNIRDIHHAVVFETDMDRFAASMYSVDWQEMVMPFLEDEARSFNFVLIPESTDEAMHFAALWNLLIKFCPIFPVTCMFYNHLGSKIFDRLINKISSDLYVHLFSFGNIDDELNQLNNALHNFRNQTRFFFPQGLSKSDMPVCVVGSGPSLDDRIEDLLAIKDQAIVISCGTALRALWHYGIKPDLHVELESDYNTYRVQSQTEDKAYMKSVRLLGATQLNPLLVELFGDSRLFFKEDGPLAHWFGKGMPVITNATPTCTNAALALVLHLNFSKVFLFGLDYGFPDRSSHHAKGSVYYSERLNNENNVSETDTIHLPAAAGGTIESTTFLYSSKRRVDNLLASNKEGKIYNCSNGAALEHTEWLVSGQAKAFVEDSGAKKHQYLQSLFSEQDPQFTSQQLVLLGKKIISEFEQLMSESEQLMTGNEFASLIGFTAYCSQMSSCLQKIAQDSPGFYFFIRGSVWHFLLAGYTHVYSMQAHQIPAYLRFWKVKFTDMLLTAMHRTRELVENQADISEDPMVNYTISKGLIDELTWEYAGYSVIDDAIDLGEFEFEFQGCFFDGNKYVPFAN